MNYAFLLFSLVLGLVPLKWVTQRFFQNPYLGWILDFAKSAAWIFAIKNQTTDWVPWACFLLLIAGHVLTPVKQWKGFDVIPLYFGAFVVLSPLGGAVGGVVFIYCYWMQNPAVIRTLTSCAAGMIAHWVLNSVEPGFFMIFPIFLLIAFQNEKEMDQNLTTSE